MRLSIAVGRDPDHLAWPWDCVGKQCFWPVCFSLLIISTAVWGCFFHFCLPSYLQRNLHHFTVATKFHICPTEWQGTENDRTSHTRYVGSKQWISDVLCSFPWKGYCSFWKKLFFTYILCVYFRPQQPWTVELTIFNLTSDLKFALRRKRQHLQRVTVQFFSSSLWFPRCPLPDLPQFESNHLRPIGCSGHVTYIGPKSTAFWDWFRIFPWELPTEPVQYECVCMCVCLRTLGKNLPPPSLPLFPTSSPLSPFLSSFFHHLPSFETQYHTLDSLCYHGKEHSFSGTATRSVRTQEVPWKTQKEQKTEKGNSNVATAEKTFES